MLKYIEIYAKCNDLFNMECFNEEGKRIRGLDYEGYVPEFLGDGDAVAIQIDVETGRIINWKPLTEEDIKAVIMGDEDEKFYETHGYLPGEGHLYGKDD